jgi:hypothetical protein
LKGPNRDKEPSRTNAMTQLLWRGWGRRTVCLNPSGAHSEVVSRPPDVRSRCRSLCLPPRPPPPPPPRPRRHGVPRPPSWADPGYFAGDDDAGPDPLNVALASKESFQAIRAFPAEAGSVIVFTHR